MSKNNTYENLINKPDGYLEETAHYWPFPAINENKIVHQLDNVTAQSEEHATQILEIIESINNHLLEHEQKVNEIIEILKSNIKLFTTLNKKFPNVIAFKTKLQKNNSALNDMNKIVETFQSVIDSIMETINIMQYQDINRQKIERVINVMRSLSNYMNNLLEGRLDDKKRVSSAQHIVGDSNEKLVSNDDIEALLAKFKINNFKV